MRHHIYDMFRNSTGRLGGGPGRIYVTCENFGVDLSVDDVEASFSDKKEEWSPSRLEIHGGVPVIEDYVCRFPFELTLKFRMPSLSLVYPADHMPRNGLQYLDPKDRMYILDHGKPIPPRLPLWLPPGLWRCCYCDAIQSEGLLQCRPCGAIRWDAKGGGKL